MDAPLHHHVVGKEYIQFNFHADFHNCAENNCTSTYGWQIFITFIPFAYTYILNMSNAFFKIFYFYVIPH